MTMQQHELLAWLGDGWTPEQIDRIIDDFQQWERSAPDAGEDLAEAVLTAIAQRVDDTLDVDELGAALISARRVQAEALLACQAATIALDLNGEIDRGQRYPEADLARRLGVDRMTVRRKWRGL